MRARLAAFLVGVIGFSGGGLGAQDVARIEIEPAGPVVLGERVRVRLSGVEPGHEYTLHTDIVDEWGRPWRSTATFIGTTDRVIDLADAAPIRGTYSGADRLGVFWSAIPRAPGTPVSPLATPADSSPVVFTLRRDATIVHTARLTRWLVKPGVTVREIRDDGIVAALYSPAASDARPLVVTLGGSGGGMTWQRTTAAVLASQGYHALAVAYFGADGLPQHLESIALEYVVRAIDRAARVPGVDTTRVAVVGLSRGAEAALLLAANVPRVGAVVGYAPSFVAFQGSRPPEFPVVPSWTFRGTPLPHVPNVEREPYRATDRESERTARYLLYNAEATRAATIPVERINGPVLLFSGRDDPIWPSPLMGQQIVQRLATSRFRHRYAHVAYDSTGHAFARPGYMPTSQVGMSGGNPRANAYAQVSAWSRMLELLAEWSARASGARS